MFRINRETHSLESVQTTNLSEENILERYDLQKMMINSWNSVRNELGIPNAFLVGEEIKAHESVQNAIDILAFDQTDNSLVVVELKRDRNKLQLLQSLSYAAMINTWDKAQLLSSIKLRSDENEELVEYIKDSDSEYGLKIILVSEKYDPEVIITADWLVSNYGLSITAYSVEIHSNEDDSFLNFALKYPLKELSEMYEARVQRNRGKNTRSDVTWEKLLPTFGYPFAKEALNAFLKIMPGDASRRRFVHIYNQKDVFGKITVSFRRKYLNIYTHCNEAEGREFVERKFGPEMETSIWRHGISFNVASKKDYSVLKEWLGL